MEDLFSLNVGLGGGVNAVCDLESLGPVKGGLCVGSGGCRKDPQRSACRNQWCECGAQGGLRHVLRRLLLGQDTNGKEWCVAVFLSPPLLVQASTQLPFGVA